MSRRHDMITILGPTASGKTALAAAVAERHHGEVISADSRQVYRRMDIGTGKDLQEYRRPGAQIAYHLIDIVEPGEEFNVFEYQRLFLVAYEAVRARGKLPVLCGGSGLYLDAVLSGYRLAEVPRDDRLRSELNELSDNELTLRLRGLRELHNTSDTSDRERLIRAIEIAEHDQRGEGDASAPPMDSRVYGIRWDRQALRNRISERLRHRLEHGLVEEIKSLLEEGVSPQQLDFYGLEYRLVTRYVVGDMARNDMIQKLATGIHQFAKRQETWFRRMQRRGLEVHWLDGALSHQALLEEISTDLVSAEGAR
ncbi:MAG: tRNA (adenosine(37)-N6)-dimethylallyltransferase MiaA [Verrucomicrobia bacterium]|nr:tRNA (adenosine(37)-N6)-dimethylallyltransferase MiaA [Verrucomicrobiota bacterium]MDA1086116.1 tRNA (adenosine(37)-N6)-dimethylallyltransferase MiaA [Verrucomicrobiota bacterium]